MGPPLEVASQRVAVRGIGAQVAPGQAVMVACSGGADSLALLLATLFEARRWGVPVVAAVIDHGLQEGSAQHTAAVAQQLQELGADRVVTHRVEVEVSQGGLEAAAREARYEALARLAQAEQCAVVLLGHTHDDQAETVLLGLARGSGAASLQGMRPEFTVAPYPARFLRPFLATRRTETEAACRHYGVTWWRDPHNEDPAFARVRVRQRVLPVLEAELGPGVAAALARTGAQLRADVEYLDSVAREVYTRLHRADGLDMGQVREQPAAIATRCLRIAAIAAGAIATELTAGHIAALLELGEGKQAQLPGHVTAKLQGQRLFFCPTVGSRPPTG